jgi:hypothetical protein
MGSIVTEADLGVSVDHDSNITPRQVGTILWTAGVAAWPKSSPGHRRRAGPVNLPCSKDLTLPT